MTDTPSMLFVKKHQKCAQKVSKITILAYFEIPGAKSDARIGFSRVELTLDHLPAVRNSIRHLQQIRFHTEVHWDFDHFTDTKDGFRYTKDVFTLDFISKHRETVCEIVFSVCEMIKIALNWHVKSSQLKVAGVT